MSTTAAQTFELCNDGTTGTSLNFLAKLNGATSSCAVKLSTSDTSGSLGIVVAGSGTTGNAVIAYRGYASCSFDGSTTAGDYIQISSTNAADCHDVGTSYPTAGQVLGRVLSTNTGAGTYGVLLGGDSNGGVAASGLASGNYPKASGSGALGDSGVTAGPYVIPWITVYRGGGSSTFSTSSNVVKLWGVVLTWPLTTTQVTYNVTTADTNSSGACNYDVGIADTAGAIKAHLGSTANQTFGSSGSHTVSWTSGSTTLQSGKYYVALTTSCTANAAVLSGDGSAASVTFQNAGTASVTAGGSLTSFTAPADSWSWGATVPAIVVR